jgi:hypothetical protein
MKSCRRLVLVLLLSTVVSACMAGDFIIVPVFVHPVRSIGVGLASMNGKYYAAYTPDANTAVHFMYSEDGTNFKETGVTPTDGTVAHPSRRIKVNLYLACQGGVTIAV